MVQSDWYYAGAIFFTMMGLAIAVAWHGGMFDESVRAVENKALDKMGENRASYGLKRELKRVQVSNDPDFVKTQGQAVDTAGGVVGKGGAGEDVGAGLSQGL